MASFNGSKVVALVALGKTPPLPLADKRLNLVVSDTVTLAAAQINDIINLGSVHYKSRIDKLSTLAYANLGASTTLKVGRPGSDAVLSAAAATTSAGERSLISAVTIDKRASPAWEQLGYASEAAALAAYSDGMIPLIATLGGGAGTGIVQWDIITTG